VQAAADWRRYAAPAAFLLAVTIAVVLVRSGLRTGAAHTVSGGAAGTISRTTTARRPTKKYWVVKAGDTFGVISARTGVPVATIERLNPKASSTSLFIGERIRLR
jgi:LysM repeat protein